MLIIRIGIFHKYVPKKRLKGVGRGNDRLIREKMWKLIYNYSTVVNIYDTCRKDPDCRG
jgi:hypothetical protein